MATLICDGQPLQLHFDAFIERLPTTGTVKLEELIHDPIIQIDGNIQLRDVYKSFEIGCVYGFCRRSGDLGRSLFRQHESAVGIVLGERTRRGFGPRPFS